MCDLQFNSLYLILLKFFVVIYSRVWLDVLDYTKEIFRRTQQAWGGRAPRNLIKRSLISLVRVKKRLSSSSIHYQFNFISSVLNKFVAVSLS